MQHTEKMEVKLKMTCYNEGFFEIIKSCAEKHPEKTALIHESRRETYSQLLKNTGKLAAALLKMGVQPGDRLAIISRNCIEYIEAEFAAYRIGAVVVKINWRMTADEIKFIIESNNVSLAFVQNGIKSTAAELTRAVPGLRTVELSDSGEFEKLKSEADEFTDCEVDPDSTALIVHTSGTTGRPKFVSYTHRDLLEKVKLGVAVLPFTEHTRFMLIEQLFHIACMRAYMTLGGGGTLILQCHFDPEEYLDTLVREHVNSVGMTPSVLKMLMDYPRLNDYDLHELEYMNYSTSAMPYPLIKEAIRRLNCGLYQIYGMTEMLGFVTVLTPEDHLSGHARSVGRPAPGYEIKTVHCDGSMCSTGETGEVLIRGPVMMRGYLGNHELSGEVLQDGWYHSKDLGFIDESGYLHICVRKDDMIISGGENIYPKEVSDVLYRLKDDISEAAVYGLPDPIWGQKVWASVVLKPDSQMTCEKLREYCKKNIANYKVPKGFDFRTELPRTATGKIDVKKLAAEQTAKL